MRDMLTAIIGLQDISKEDKLKMVFKMYKNSDHNNSDFRIKDFIRIVQLFNIHKNPNKVYDIFQKIFQSIKIDPELTKVKDLLVILDKFP